MVMTFRVSELQTLLGLTSQSKCGRKTELLQRCLVLIERGLPAPVQAKIREMYRKYIPATRAMIPAASASNGYVTGAGGLPSAAAQMINKCAPNTMAQGNKGAVKSIIMPFRLT